MEQAGAQVERYHPLAWYTLARLNHRTHRRLLVVDGRIGFTGGVGIGDEWLGNAQDQDHWRESHFRLEGPAVAQMQAAFLDNWLKTHSEVLHGDDYFPAAASRRRHGGPGLQELLPRRQRERPHDVPALDRGGEGEHPDLGVLLRAGRSHGRDARRGPTQRRPAVRIILPGPVMDVEVSRKASRGRWGALLSAGVEIYEYQPTMYHCKVMIVDGIWVSAGSTNFDNRSFRLNDEANLNVLDRGFARQLTETFERDRAQVPEDHPPGMAAPPVEGAGAREGRGPLPLPDLTGTGDASGALV